MQEEKFKEYLSQEYTKPSTIATYMSDARSAERSLGDLDEFFEEDLDRSLPDGLKRWERSAVYRYREFLSGDKEDEAGDNTISGGRFSLEADLQSSLRDNLDQISPGLVIADDNSEKTTKAGRIDILARDSDGTFWIIELKAGKANEKAVGQLAAYMGALAEEETGDIRGLLVAREFTEKARYASRTCQKISLKRYGFSFTFEDIS